jgi:hypothetical protein
MNAPDLLFRLLTFRTAVLLYPVATVLHVADEWPGFPRWARRFACARYSDREYTITHVLAVGISITSLTATLVVAVAFHTLEVGHDVFKRW